MPYPPQKNIFKRKGNSITLAKANAPIPQTFSECLKLTIQTYQMRNKELKMKLFNGIKVRVFFEKNIEKSTCPSMIRIHVTFANQVIL